MDHQDRWIFSKEFLRDKTPSRLDGMSPEVCLLQRQQAANVIQMIGQKLKVTQLVINTAIVYMHRFYMFHSFTKFHRNAISPCALFLAAKVEEQPRKLEHIIKVSQICIFRDNIDSKSEKYQSLAAQFVYNENLMLRTLGFDLNIQHSHTSIVSCCQLVRATKYIAETSYYLATNSLHLSTLCLQYKPTVIACICIYFVCKWSNFHFPKSSEGKDWWTYVDDTVTKEMLEELMSECVAIFQKCPQRLKNCLADNMKMNSISNNVVNNNSTTISNTNTAINSSSNKIDAVSPPEHTPVEVPASAQKTELSDDSDHSKKPKKKHKHKEKHKHKDKHKHKHKDKDKDKEKHREKYNVEPSFQIEQQPETGSKVAPLKLKILAPKRPKGEVGEFSPVEDQEKIQPLKIKINLSNHQRSSSESSNNIDVPVSRKRKRSDKKDIKKALKLAIHDLDANIDN